MTQAIALAVEPEVELDDLLEADIENCQRDVRARMAAENAYKVDSRQRLDSILGQVLGFGQRWLSADAQLLNDAYRMRGILPTPVGGNHFLQLTYLLTGQHDPEKRVKYHGVDLPKFLPGKSLAKYAGALRLMDEEGITPDDVPAFIDNFGDRFPGYGNRLNGMLALDRERQGAGTRDMFVSDAELLDQAAYEAIMRDDMLDRDWKEEELAKPRKFALAWVVVTDDRTFVGGLIEKSEAKAKSAALKTVERA